MKSGLQSRTGFRTPSPEGRAVRRAAVPASPERFRRHPAEDRTPDAVPEPQECSPQSEPPASAGAFVLRRLKTGRALLCAAVEFGDRIEGILPIAGLDARRLDGRAVITSIAGRLAASADAAGQRFSADLRDPRLALRLKGRHADGELVLDEAFAAARQARLEARGKLALAGDGRFEASGSLSRFDPRAFVASAPPADLNARFSAAGRRAAGSSTRESGKAALALRPRQSMPCARNHAARSKAASSSSPRSAGSNASASTPCRSSASSTPQVKAPCAPPPCRARWMVLVVVSLMPSVNHKQTKSFR